MNKWAQSQDAWETIPKVGGGEGGELRVKGGELLRLAWRLLKASEVSGARGGVCVCVWCMVKIHLCFF